MLSNLLAIGDKLDIRLWSEEVEGVSDIGKHYKSVIFELPDDENIIVTIPTERERLVLLPVETRLTVISYSKKGVFMCTTRLAERFKSGTVYLMRLEITSKITKYQRRSYYRIPCDIEAQFRVLPEDVKISKVTEENLDYYMEMSGESDMIKGAILDISGGGVRLRTYHKAPEKSVLLMSFIMENETYIFEPLLLGRVLHCDPVDNSSEIYEYRVEFQGISEVDREIIIKFIFEEERKSKRR